MGHTVCVQTQVINLPCSELELCSSKRTWHIGTGADANHCSYLTQTLKCLLSTTVPKTLPENSFNCLNPRCGWKSSSSSSFFFLFLFFFFLCHRKDVITWHDERVCERAHSSCLFFLGDQTKGLHWLLVDLFLIGPSPPLGIHEQFWQFYMSKCFHLCLISCSGMEGVWIIMHITQKAKNDMWKDESGRDDRFP